jgi:lambda family phage portal protein
LAADRPLNALDRLIGWFSPASGLSRARDRAVLAYYEAAKPDGKRKYSRDRRGPNALVASAAVPLRTQMRHLERNHDLTVGAINVLVNNVVGPQGIGVEFQPRRADGSIHTEYAQQLAAAWRDWCARPEVTAMHSWSKAQRLVARTWFRDGECFAQRLLGKVDYLDHGTRVPYSLELFEPDLVPHEFTSDQGKRVRQGVELNAWNRPVAYWVFRNHPGEAFSLAGGGATQTVLSQGDLKRIPADRMLHLADRQRIGQVRGVTRFASVINRIADIKEYEDAERIAAKVAASLTAYVKRHAPEGEGYTPAVDEQGNLLPRDIKLEAGMIIDTLAVGEEIGLIDSKRPNPNLITFRNGQLRAFAAGISASYSSVSRNYDGTYSAQRQEMVEQWTHYAALTDDFVTGFVAPVVADFVIAANASGVVRRPADVVADREDDVLFVAPSMPWIDPAKEALAHLTLVKAGFASEVEVIRRRGQVPDHVLQQIKEWRRKVAEADLAFDSDAALALAASGASMNDGAAAPAPAPAPAPDPNASTGA